MLPARISQGLCWIHRTMSQEQGSHASFWRVIKGAFQAIPTLPRATFGPKRLVYYSSYYATIAAGNISFRLAVDTGSSDMLITSTDCASNACRSIPKYPLKYQSPTFVSLNGNTTTFNVSYADGTCACALIASTGPRFHI